MTTKDKYCVSFEFCFVLFCHQRSTGWRSTVDIHLQELYTCITCYHFDVISIYVIRARTREWNVALTQQHEQIMFTFCLRQHSSFRMAFSYKIQHMQSNLKGKGQKPRDMTAMPPTDDQDPPARHPPHQIKPQNIWGAISKRVS